MTGGLNSAPEAACWFGIVGAAPSTDVYCGPVVPSTAEGLRYDAIPVTFTPSQAKERAEAAFQASAQPAELRPDETLAPGVVLVGVAGVEAGAGSLKRGERESAGD